MNRKQFIIATVPYWFICAGLVALISLMFSYGYISANTALGWTILITWGFNFYFWKGQYARCLDIGFNKGLSFSLVAIMAVLAFIMNLHTSPAGTIISYLFPFVLMFIPTNATRKY